MNRLLINWKMKFEQIFNDLRLFFLLYEARKIDPIFQYTDFKKLVIKAKEKKMYFDFNSSHGDSIRYGHLRAISEYAYNKFNCSIKGVSIEHGVNFSDADITSDKYDKYFTFIFQSNHKFNKVEKFDSASLHFSIGPYIHYARPSISADNLCSIKSKFGKTLLVVPSHTFERSSLCRKNDEYFEKLIINNSNKYDTILVCVFWNDVNDPIYLQMSKHPKVKLVSAGFKFDDLFIRRLRTIYELADEVVGNDVGTYIGYAMCLNKKVSVCEIEDELHYFNETHSEEEIKRFKQNRREVIDAINSEDHDRIQSIYEKFWGGNISLKSREEMKEIFNQAKKCYSKNKYRRYNFLLRKYFNIIWKKEK